MIRLTQRQLLSAAILVALAIVLSMIVLFGWQYMFAIPKMKAEEARQAEIALHAKKPQAPAALEA